MTKSRFNTRSLAFTGLLVVSLVLFSSFDRSNARENKHSRQTYKASVASMPNKNVKPRHVRSRLSTSKRDSIIAGDAVPSKSVTIFDVTKYGAKGDGRADDTKAFQATWAAACRVEASTMIVPSGSVFLVKPVSFSGPNCASNIVFQLDGKIIAPTSAGDWGSGLLQWIQFKSLKGITIRGKGIIDGQGSVWWSNGEMPSIKPTALRFYGSSNVAVTGITIQNSPQTHLKFDSCTGVHVYGMSVSSPGDSPNTDGIHLQNTQNVLIHDTNLACGDDCVSIQTGCSNIYIHDINCGPGHGISIGSLGKANTKACVSNVTVRNVIMHNTLTGVRIKTWQGGSGSVKGVLFSNIQVSEVETPIMIDQFYCDKSKCNNESSAVSVSGITYENIRGTYTVKPVHFACSDSVPCRDVSLNTIQLKSSVQQTHKSYDPENCHRPTRELFAGRSTITQPSRQYGILLNYNSANLQMLTCADVHSHTHE